MSEPTAPAFVFEPAPGNDVFDGVDEPWIAYSIPLRAAEVKFNVTRRKYPKFTAFRISTSSYGIIIAVSTRLWPRLSLSSESLRVCIAVKPLLLGSGAMVHLAALRDPDGGAEHADGIDRFRRVLAQLRTYRKLIDFVLQLSFLFRRLSHFQLIQQAVQVAAADSQLFGGF